MDDIVISGIGMITPFGVGTEKTWNGVKSGRSAIRPITRFDVSSLRTRFAGTFPDEYDVYATSELSPRLFTQATDFTRLALLAGKLAFKDAALVQGEVDPYRVAVCSGTAE